MNATCLVRALVVHRQRMTDRKTYPLRQRRGRKEMAEAVLRKETDHNYMRQLEDEYSRLVAWITRQAPERPGNDSTIWRHTICMPRFVSWLVYPLAFVGGCGIGWLLIKLAGG